MSTQTRELTKRNELFDGFEIWYEIPNFLKDGVVAKLPATVDRIGPWKTASLKFKLSLSLLEMRISYAENIKFRVDNIGKLPYTWPGIHSYMLMIEIIRIIRNGFLEEIPHIREAILYVFDKIPFENKNFNFNSMGPAYFPKIWSTGVEEETFAKFIANMTANFELSETQKDRIQSVLSRTMDEDIRETLFMARMREYFLYEKHQVVLEVLNPKVVKLERFPFNKMGEFLQQLDNKGMEELKRLIPDLNTQKGHSAMKKLYDEYIAK